MTTPLGLAKPWVWVQPTTEEILPRLRDCFELNVNERERENMCSVAFQEIARLRRQNNRQSLRDNGLTK